MKKILKISFVAFAIFIVWMGFIIPSLNDIRWWQAIKAIIETISLLSVLID